MEVTTAHEASEAPARSGDQPDIVRITVINNSQIVASVLKAGSLTITLAFVLGLALRALPSGHFKDMARTLNIALIACGCALLILSHYLDRALRRCPVCRTRITKKTEEKRRCLQCDTELWGYWDE